VSARSSPRLTKFGYSALGQPIRRNLAMDCSRANCLSPRALSPNRQHCQLTLVEWLCLALVTMLGRALFPRQQLIHAFHIVVIMVDDSFHSFSSHAPFFDFILAHIGSSCVVVSACAACLFRAEPLAFRSHSAPAPGSTALSTALNRSSLTEQQ
jgi:hypothetical protein